MDMNSIGSIMQMIQSGDISSSGHNRPMPPPPMGMGSESGLQLSPMGKMMGNMPELSSEEISQLKDFRSQMMTAIQSGEFDAEEMAANAPEFMQQHAEENGVDLAEMLELMGDRMSSMPPPRPMGPPPEMMQLSDAEAMQQLRLKPGRYNAYSTVLGYCRYYRVSSSQQQYSQGGQPRADQPEADDHLLF